MNLPEITTQRLQLRKLAPSDKRAIFSIRASESVNKYIGRAIQKNEVDSLVFINNINHGIAIGQWFYWAICLSNKGRFVGTVCLWNFSKGRTVAEIGYELLPEYQGKGIMSEAIRSVLKFAFSTLKLDTVEAQTHKKNGASVKLLLSCGFTEMDKRTVDNENNVLFALCK